MKRTTMKGVVAPFLLVFGFLLLSACGDGGGYSGSSSSPGSGGGGGGGGGGTPASGSLTLSWDAVGDPRVTGYKIYYSAAPFSSTTNTHAVSVGDVTNYTLSPNGFTAGSTLYIGVAAVGSGMESPMSDVVAVVLE